MSQEYYWSVCIEPGWVQASIWTIEDKNARVLAISPVSHWEAEEDLVHTVDSALSSIVESLPEDAKEPNQTVFGVGPSWVEGGQIKKEHLGKIRDISSKLSLKPSGFVVLPEAIAHSLKVKEGSPLTGVIIGIEDGNFDATVFRLGNLVGTVRVGRSVSIVDDIVEALARFGSTEPLPSRFLIYNGKEKELEEVQAALVNADWTGSLHEKVKFLHTPKVEVVTPEQKVLAVSLAGASEIGKVESITMGDEKSTKPNLKADDKGELTAKDVGFVMGKDVKKVEKDAPPPSSPSLPKLPNIKFSPKFPKLRIPIPRMSGGSKAKKIFVSLGTLTILGLGGLLAAWWYVPKAEVVVFVSPQRLEEREFITLDESVSDPDLNELLLPAQVVSEEVSGEKIGKATGSITVGEKAKGNVTVRNGTSQAIQLSAGDELFGPGDLKFTLDQTASVSAATSPSSPGTATLALVATNFGAEYNIAKDEELKVSNFPKSEVDAIVNENLTGGSSRDIVAVSQNDLDELEETLTSELEESGTRNLESKVGSDKVLLRDALIIDPLKKDFSHKAGDEATDVTFNLELELSALVVSKDTLTRLSESILINQVPEGFSLRAEQLDYEFQLEEEGDGFWVYEITIIANLLPKIDTEDLAKKIAGKSPQEAQNFLNQIGGYSGAEIRIRPPLPGFLGNIPRNQKNITFEIVAER